MVCTCSENEPHSCSHTKYAWFESRKERDSMPDQEKSELIINQNGIIPKEFAKYYLSVMSHEQITEIADKLAEYFLEMIKKDSSTIDFDMLEKRLKIKYRYDFHSAMFLEGKNGLRIIVDHGITRQWSEINCKTEIKMFEKCGIKVVNHIVGEKVYSYVIQPNEKFYNMLAKIPDSEWKTTSKITRTIPQDVIVEIEKTAENIGFTLDEILQLMAENAYISELRTKAA